MKKVKIMMLSLVLFALAGGALAFKAKTLQSFCIVNALYYDPAGEANDKYFCRYNIGLGIPAGQINATLNCNVFQTNAVEINVLPTLQAICTTLPPIGVNSDAECQTVKCPNTTSLIDNS